MSTTSSLQGESASRHTSDVSSFFFSGLRRILDQTHLQTGMWQSALLFLYRWTLEWCRQSVSHHLVAHQHLKFPPPSFLTFSSFHSSVDFEGLVPIVQEYLEREGKYVGSDGRKRCSYSPSTSLRVITDAELRRRQENIFEVSGRAFKTRAILTPEFSLQGCGAENELSWQVSTSRLERFNFASV